MLTVCIMHLIYFLKFDPFQVGCSWIKNVVVSCKLFNLPLYITLLWNVLTITMFLASVHFPINCLQASWIFFLPYCFLLLNSGFHDGCLICLILSATVAWRTILEGSCIWDTCRFVRNLMTCGYEHKLKSWKSYIFHISTFCLMEMAAWHEWDFS